MRTMMKFRILILAILLMGMNFVYAAIAQVFNVAPGSAPSGDAAWPSPRFTVMGDCVQDNLTGLVWLKNADYSASNFTNPAIWSAAQTDITNFNNNGGACGYTDWRLPSVTELRALVNYATDQGPDYWLNHNGFNNVQDNYYWSSTPYQSNTSGAAWFVDMSYGDVNYGVATDDTDYVWPVRGGGQ